MNQSSEGIPIINLPHNTDIAALDQVYIICDAEFNSRKDVHDSFSCARGIKSWARFYLMHLVKEVATREGYSFNYYQLNLIATKISQDWFAQSASVLN